MVSRPEGTRKAILVALAGGLRRPQANKLAPKIKLDKVHVEVYSGAVMAKYDSMRKLERNKALREFALAHPELSGKEIGTIFNISESRVWRIRFGAQGGSKRREGEKPEAA